MLNVPAATAQIVCRSRHSRLCLRWREVVPRRMPA